MIIKSINQYVMLFVFLIKNLIGLIDFAMDVKDLIGMSNYVHVIKIIIVMKHVRKTIGQFINQIAELTKIEIFF